MDKLMEIGAWLVGPQAALLYLALWQVSEFLGSNDKIKANGIYQLIKQGLGYLIAKVPVKK